MNQKFFLTTAAIGALLVGGLTVDLHAQRGAGIGHASIPANAGQGRPATAGRPDGAGRPAGGTGRSNTNTGKPDATGKPTIADQLTRDHGLATQLQKLFPMGTDLVAESKGFNNLGQFVAAAHVAANNPNFTFDELKAKMLGGMPLGKAIQALDPHADAQAEADKAENEAAADLKAAGRHK